MPIYMVYVVLLTWFTHCFHLLSVCDLLGASFVVSTISGILPSQNNVNAIETVVNFSERSIHTHCFGVLVIVTDV